jgi:hypothetical protein
MTVRAAKPPTARSRVGGPFCSRAADLIDAYIDVTFPRTTLRGYFWACPIMPP